MNRGSQPLKLLEKMKRAGKRVVSRTDLARLGVGMSHPDRAMSKLVSEHLVEKLDRGVWLVPTGRRPRFDVPRFWSNPDLADPLVISALVVRNPTMRDVARLVIAYGANPALRAVEMLVDEGEITERAAARASRMIENARIGLAHAAA